MEKKKGGPKPVFLFPPAPRLREFRMRETLVLYAADENGYVKRYREKNLC